MKNAVDGVLFVQTLRPWYECKALLNWRGNDGLFRIGKIDNFKSRAISFFSKKLCTFFMSAMDKNLVYNQADEVHRQLDELVRPHEP